MNKNQKSKIKNQVSKIGSVPIFSIFLVPIFVLVFSFYSVSFVALAQTALPSTLYSQEEEILPAKELTIRAWEALAAKDYEAVTFYTDKCVELYQKEADEQQASLEDFPARGKEEQFSALNNVATSLFIKGEALRAQERWDEAKDAFKSIIARYSFAQYWDPRGWFWKVAEESKWKLEKIDKAIEGEGGDEIK